MDWILKKCETDDLGDLINIVKRSNSKDCKIKEEAGNNNIPPIKVK